MTYLLSRSVHFQQLGNFKESEVMLGMPEWRVAGVAWGRVEVWVGTTLQKQLGNFEIASVDGVEERRHTLFVGLI